MLTLSWWEQFIVLAAVSFLTMLQQKISNAVEADACGAAIAFLQTLLSGKVAVVATPTAGN